jgi:hypothetical protein
MWEEPLTLSIVIPAFNEAQRLVDKMALLNDAVSAGIIDPWVTELIFVDDGSTDETGQLAKMLLAPAFPRMRILRLRENSGKGAAIRAGTAVAAAPVVAFLDADMSVDPAQVPLLLAAVQHSDVAIGSRSLTESTVQSDSTQRKVMSRTFNLLVNALTEVELKDTQCGFKAFRTPVARILFHLMVVDRFAFDVEILCLARRLGMQISEVPVHWEATANSTVNPMTDSISMIVDVFRMRLRRKRPGIPALFVTADSGKSSPVRERILAEAFTSFRKTDPILPLPDEGALILLPLCDSHEIQGTATRLGAPLRNLTVDRRLISCSELMDMMPLTWVSADNTDEVALRDVDSVLSERRMRGRPIHGTEHIGWRDLEPSSKLEA